MDTTKQFCDYLCRECGIQGDPGKLHAMLKNSESLDAKLIREAAADFGWSQNVLLTLIAKYNEFCLTRELPKLNLRLFDQAQIQHRSHDEVWKPRLQTDLGRLYEGDCLQFLKSYDGEDFDLIFADPPFNLEKEYPSGISDGFRDAEYVNWCKEWLELCIHHLKPGGALLVWNLPKWSALYSGFLGRTLEFRHWISVSMKYSLPIRGKLYPAHYALLYYTKGKKPNAFHPDRLPMEICPSCKTDLKDYGGYKNKMNPEGISLSDVWTDIYPVRHSRYKKRKGANELSVKLMDRIIEMASNKGDLVFDPFGGAGTTFAVAELKGRRWVGTEIGGVNVIQDRFSDLSSDVAALQKARSSLNSIFSVEDRNERKKRGLWVTEDFNCENEEAAVSSDQITLL